MIPRFVLVLFLVTNVAMKAFAAEIVQIIPPAPVVLPAGGHGTISVHIRVKQGFHVQANPVLNKFLIPIVLKLHKTPGIDVGEPLYPEAKKMRLEGSDEDLVIYDGEFIIQQPVTVHKANKPGLVRLEGSLRYQACDDSHCLIPRRLPITLGVRITP